MSRAPLAAAVMAVLAAGWAFNAHAAATAAQGTTAVQSTTGTQSTNNSKSKSKSKSKKKTQKLEQVLVTGSLIPQTEIETSTPVTTITAEDIKARGFATVAEALQATSFATGSVQGQQSSASFTQGAATVSLFGLNPGYVKYLINGRPMGSFPALYNGSDAFNNIAGIPADLVDHIDILPGGQSSLYGSDAIAGVINIVLKDHLKGPTIDARYGWYSDGGGANRRISMADTWHWGNFNLLAGVQWDSEQPIWGFDRSLTKQRYRDGITPPHPAFDVVEYSVLDNNLYLLDPAKCGNDSSLFRGTEKLASRPGEGQYCGSLYTPGFKTVTNRKRTGNAYLHATYDVTPDFRLYSDLLYKYADTRYTAGSGYTFWSTGISPGAFWDPNANNGAGDLVEFQKVFAPEEVGQYSSIMSKQYDNSMFFTVGGNGTFGSDWDYDVSITHSQEHLTVSSFVRFFQPIQDYFGKILGPQLGVDPYFNYYPVYSPDYAAFFSPIPVSDFNSFTGYAPTHSKTWDNLLRAQITDSSLFSLPGGDAGLAVVAEGGNSGWDYSPNPLFLNGSIWGQTDVQGNGHRSRNALTSELRMPFFNWLTLDLSGRHDDYKAASKSFNKSTYMAGIEIRPIESLLLRGRYGTAFKAPTLPDEFQGLSGYYTFVPDYYVCSLLGYDPAHIGQCPNRYSSEQVFGQQSGNTDLKPINADVWSYGVVWSPTAALNFSVDYFHTSINNEVNQKSAAGLMLSEYQCRTGIIDITSPTCVNTLAQVTRNAQGTVDQIFTPKVNVSNELTDALVAHASWRTDLGYLGRIALQGSYSDELKHTYQAYPGDQSIDLLRHPGYSTDFKTKANATLNWSKNQWSATLYVNRYGKTPNHVATTQDSYSYPNAGTLAPWILYNASVRYQFTPSLQLSFLVNNLFNSMPPADHTYPGTTGTPYNTSNYNVFGRAMYIEANYQFGQ